jgi:hypothetical protein
MIDLRDGGKPVGEALITPNLMVPAAFHYVITLSAYMRGQSRVSSFSRCQ